MRSVEAVSTEVLATWATKRLLGLRDRLLRCEEAIERSDIDSGDAALDPKRIYFKNDPRWIELHDSVRKVLSAREHVASGAERAAARASAAKGVRPRENPRPKAPRR